MQKTSKNMKRRISLFSIAATIVGSSMCTVDGAAFTKPTLCSVRSTETWQRSFQKRCSALTMYVPSSSPVSQTSIMAASITDSDVSSPQVRQDTLPSFRAANGLLSPQTVERLDGISDGSSVAVQYFLHTYRKFGPMACLPILSDPEVLPELTKAMREITR